MGTSKYPNALDNTTSVPKAIDNVTPVAADIFNRLRDAVVSVEAELGADPSREYGTVRARLDALSTALSAELSEASSSNAKQDIITIESNGQTSFTLVSVPFSDLNVQMYVNGVKILSNEYSVSGTSVTYSGTLTLLTVYTLEFWYLV